MATPQHGLAEGGLVTNILSTDNTATLSNPSGNIVDISIEGTALLTAPINTFTGQMALNGGFTNGNTTALWIAPAPVYDPTTDSQGEYIQYRVLGNLHGGAHEALAAEIRVTNGTNAGFVNALESTVELGGATTISDARSITSNFVFEAGLTGALTNASVIRSQTLDALPVGFTVTNVYGLYVEGQNVGTNNYTIYAPTGTSVIGSYGFTPTGLQWTDAGLCQTTVGVAGAASALPAAPTKYLKVRDSTGAVLVVPAYLP